MELALLPDATPPARRSLRARAAHALLLRFPLLWRLHLHSAVLIGLACWSVCMAAAYLVPSEPNLLWTNTQLNALQSSLLLFVSTAAAAWARLQLRYPCASQRIAVRLRCAALNVLVLLFILSSLVGQAAMIGLRMAPAVARADVDTLLQRPPYGSVDWSCKQPPSAGEETFRLRTMGKVAAQMNLEVRRISCEEASDDDVPSPWFRAYVAQPDGTPADTLFAERLLALREQQRLVEQGLLPAWIGTALLALLGAELLWLLGMPSAQRHRRRLRVPGWLRRPRIPLRLFAGYEKYLLLRHPQAWVIETHRVVAKGIAIGLLLLAIQALSVDPPFAVLLVAAGIGIAAAQLVRLFNRFSIYRLPTHDWRTRAALALTLLAFGVAGSWVVTERSREPASEFMFWLFLIGIPLCTAGLLANVLNKMLAFFVWLTGLTVAGLGAALTDYAEVLAGSWFAFALMCWCVPIKRTEAPSRWVLIIATFVVATLPLAYITSFMSGRHLEPGMRSSSETLMFAAWLLCYCLMQGACRVLARHQWAPRLR